MPQINNHKQPRILILRAGALGDTVCASSIIEPLRHHYGNEVIIDWVAKAGVGKLFSSDKRIHHIFEIKSRKMPIFFNPEKIAIIKQSILQPYDIIINLELGTFFNNLVRLTRAKYKVGMPYKHFTESAETHAVENFHMIYKSFLNKADMKFASPSLLGTQFKQVQEKFSLPENYIVLVPGNSHSGKKSSVNHRAWPVEYWSTLINKLSEKQIHAVLIGSQAELKQMKELLPPPSGIISLIGKTNFPDLIGVIKGAKAMVTTDTGPSHIAAAVNTPVYAIIGPTNFKRTGPYSTKDNEVKILSANLSCSPCYHTEKLDNCQTKQCMFDVKPHNVMEALEV